ncbi:MAG: hypothetical protein JW797_20390 [Bradymonadales bacterium]|nr:hypothetical protein [Bradymonadales bacterium]
MKQPSEEKLRKMIVKLLSLGDELVRLGGPSADGDLFERYIALEDDILHAVGLTTTAENQNLFLSQLGSPDRKAAADSLFDVLLAKAQSDPKHLSPVEILCYGLSEGMAAENVLPRMGLTNHVYQIFLYELVQVQPDLLMEVYQEMCLAESHLSDLALLKMKRDALMEANLRFLDLYLRSNTP